MFFSIDKMKDFIHISVPALKAQNMLKTRMMIYNKHFIFIKVSITDSFYEAAPLICLYISFCRKQLRSIYV